MEDKKTIAKQKPYMEIRREDNGFRISIVGVHEVSDELQGALGDVMTIVLK